MGEATDDQEVGVRLMCIDCQRFSLDPIVVDDPMTLCGKAMTGEMTLHLGMGLAFPLALVQPSADRDYVDAGARFGDRDEVVQRAISLR